MQKPEMPPVLGTPGGLVQIELGRWKDRPAAFTAHKNYYRCQFGYSTRHRDGKYVSKALLQTAVIILYLMLSTVNMHGTSQKNRGRVGWDNTALRHAL